MLDAYLWKFFIIVSSSSADTVVWNTSFITSRTAFLSFSLTRTRSSMRSFSTKAFFVIYPIISSSDLLLRFTDAPLTVNARSPLLKRRATSQSMSSSTKPYGAFMNRSLTDFIEVFIWLCEFIAIYPCTSSNACAFASVPPSNCREN